MNSICVTASGEDATEPHLVFINGLRDIYERAPEYRCRKALDLNHATLTVWNEFRWIAIIAPYVTGNVMQWGVDWRSEVEVENHEGLETDFDGEVFSQADRAIEYYKALLKRLADAAVD